MQQINPEHFHVLTTIDVIERNKMLNTYQPSGNQSQFKIAPKAHVKRQTKLQITYLPTAKFPSYLFVNIAFHQLT